MSGEGGNNAAKAGPIFSLSLSLATIIMTGTMQPLLAKLGMDGLKDGLVPCQIHVAWCSVDIVEILFLIFF